MSLVRRLGAALLGGVLLCAGHLARAGDTEAQRLRAQAPEEWLEQPNGPPGKLDRPWYALRLQGGALDVSAVTRTRASRDRFAPGAAPASAAEGPPKQRFHAVLDLPPGALLAVRPLYDEASDAALRALLGRHPNQLPTPALLTAQWRLALKPSSAAQGEAAWELFTDVQRRPDGQLLAGSLRLMARKGSDGPVTALMPPAHGMAFQRQELLWVGWLPGQSDPGLLVRRTLLTGEQEHLLILNGQITIARIDPDAPTVSFSSGVDDEAGFEQTPFAQKRPPEYIAGQAALKFDAQEWVRLLESAQKTPLVARRLMQQQASLGQEPLKVFIDYLPRLAFVTDADADANTRADDAAARASSASPDNWGGSLLIKVEFRGKTSVLMEAGYLEDPLAITLGQASDGTPALLMDYGPHYNNSFSRSWIWDAAAGRFRRWTNRQSQGC